MNSENQDNPDGENPDGENPDSNLQISSQAVEDDSAIVLAEPVESPEAASSLRPRPLGAGDYLSWAVVILITLFIAVETAMGQFGEHEPRETTAADLMQINLQSKVLVGQRVVAELLEQEEAARDDAKDLPAEDAVSEKNAAAETKGETAAETTAEPEALDAGTYEQRLCYAILLSELHGPQRAVDYFETLDQKVADAKFEPNETQRSLRSSIDALLADYAAGDFSQNSISDSEKAELEKRLGFSGELILTPKGADDQAGRKWVEQVAQNKIYAAGVILIFGILFFMAGIVAACTILGVVFSDSSPIRFVPKNQVGGIYLQTFAIWLFGFFGIQLALPSVIEALGLEVDARFGIYFNFVVFFLSLSALVWPIIRGRSWGEVCHDIGWTGESFFRNVGVGIATYAAWLPMVLIGIFSVFILMLLFPMSTEVGEFELPASPSHPIQHLMSSGDSTIWIGVFLAACVAAPIVEETMFRGVLYRHLRERSIHWNRVISVTVAAIVNGVIFAAIHPQGVLAIPLLTTLAVGFTLAREWRGSLVSSITMHAINNSMVTAMMFFLM